MTWLVTRLYPQAPDRDSMLVAWHMHTHLQTQGVVCMLVSEGVTVDQQPQAEHLDLSPMCSTIAMEGPRSWTYSEEEPVRC